jgi:Zn-dependent peptidase ImmA (M78 family)
MTRATEVPITPSVLRWAIEESGYEPEQIARAVGVQIDLLRGWLSGESKPNLTFMRKLASKLHRPLAAFLLPAPPASRPLSVEFRHPFGDRRELNPSERRYLRRAARSQEMLSWLVRELGLQSPQQMPLATTKEDPAIAANAVRRALGISATAQMQWGTPGLAFDRWREALETVGYFVFLFPLGKDSCRGFSLWDDFAPVVAINTAWNESARIFTLFHETGHLISRTNSACVESGSTGSRMDPVERWCERFAADVLMPSEDVRERLKRYGWRPGQTITDLDPARRIATAYKVSLRASVIRLIDLDAATWNLYDRIPPVSDQKSGGGGGGGRDRTEIRVDQFGSRATSLLATAVEHELLSRSQAVDFLDIPDVRFERLVHAEKRDD